MHSWKSKLLELLSLIFGAFRIFRPLVRLLLRAYYLSELRHGNKGNVPASTQFDGPARLVGTGKLVLGEYCRLGRNVLFETNGNAEIVIGDRVRINDGTIITAHVGIQIGSDTMIGEYVSVRDANHGLVLGELISKQNHHCQAVRIGRDVWIGRGSCILKGVSIGEGSVVGANSVVNCNIPAKVIFAGVPAKMIRERYSGTTA